MGFDTTGLNTSGVKTPSSKLLTWIVVAAIAIVATIYVSEAIAARSAETALEARRERIAAMSAAEKEQLRLKQERFARLDESERQRLRALHDAIESHPRHEELNRVLLRYRQWLRELTPEDRASLVTTEPAKRLALVQSLQEKQHQRYLAEAAKEMSEQEIRTVKNWMDAIAKERVPKAMEVGDEWHKVNLEKHKDNPSAQRGIVWDLIFKGKVAPVTKQDHERLASTLSPTRRDAYERAKSDEEREQVANAWIMAAMWSRRGWGPGPGPSHDDLEKELAKLSPEEHSRISKLPPEQMRDELRRKWFETRFRGRPGGRGQGEGPPFGGPGRGGPDRDGPGRDGPGRGGPDRGGPGRGGPGRDGPEERGGRRGGERRDDDAQREGGRGRRGDREDRNERDAKSGAPTKGDGTPTAPEPS